MSAANDGVETTTTTTTASTTTNRDASKVPIGGCLDAEILSVSCEPFSNSSSETNPDNGSYSVINGSSSVLTTFQPLAAVAEEECQESDDSQTLLSSLVCPLTPIETVANELHDLQTIAPPLSYFENVVRGHMTSSSGKLVGKFPPCRFLPLCLSLSITISSSNRWWYLLQKQLVLPVTRAKPTPTTIIGTTTFSQHLPQNSFPPHPSLFVQTHLSRLMQRLL